MSKIRVLSFLAVLTLAFASATTTFAQQRLLPTQFGNWRLSNCTDKPIDPNLAQEAGEQASRSCQFSSGTGTITVWAGKYRDASSAYEVYTEALKPGMITAHLGQVSAFSKEGIVVLLGNVVLSSTANASREDLTALMKTEEATNGKAPLPPIPTYLPDAGRVPGTERYALGPVAFRVASETLGRAQFAALADRIGFNSGAEAMLARYQAGRDAGVLLLIDYPTPQLAELHLRHLQQAVQKISSGEKTGIERKGSLLSIVLTPTSEAYAEKLRSAVNYETQVTWNEASQVVTDPPWTSVISKIFIGTGVFMVVAVVLGIAFGGVRVVTKMLFPGKVFDRPESMDILQLGLSGKRIDSRDFY